MKSPNPNWAKDKIDISKRPDFKEIVKKAGSVKSDAKKKAAKLRWLARAETSEDRERMLWEIINDPKMFDFEMVTFYESMLQQHWNELTPKLKNEIIRTLIQIKDSTHGKVSKNLNVNIDLTEWLKNRESEWKAYLLSTKTQTKKEESS